MAATASQTNLAGLPRRLVQDGIIAEDKLQGATEAARKEKLPLVAYLVNQELADPRAIAVAASRCWTSMLSSSNSRSSAP